MSQTKPNPNLNCNLCGAVMTENLNIASKLLVAEFKIQSLKQPLHKTEQKALGI